MECPITHEIFDDPILVPCCGNSFERIALSDWFERHETCPMCRQHMPSFEPLIQPTNIALANMIDDYLASIRPINRPIDTRPSTWILAKKVGRERCIRHVQHHNTISRI